MADRVGGLNASATSGAPTSDRRRVRQNRELAIADNPGHVASAVDAVMAMADHVHARVRGFSQVSR
jgi:hypothetical protein